MVFPWLVITRGVPHFLPDPAPYLQPAVRHLLAPAPEVNKLRKGRKANSRGQKASDCNDKRQMQHHSGANTMPTLLGGSFLLVRRL